MPAGTMSASIWPFQGAARPAVTTRIDVGGARDVRDRVSGGAGHRRGSTRRRRRPRTRCARGEQRRRSSVAKRAGRSPRRCRGRRRSRSRPRSAKRPAVIGVPPVGHVARRLGEPLERVPGRARSRVPGRRRRTLSLAIAGHEFVVHELLAQSRLAELGREELEEGHFRRDHREMRRHGHGDAGLPRVRDDDKVVVGPPCA